MISRRALLRAAAGGVATTGVGLASPSMASLAANSLLAPRGEGEPARLHFNENALGMSPAARQAVVDNLAKGSHYPGPAADNLAARLADNLGLSSRQIILGNGSSQILQMAALHALQSEMTVFAPELTFEVLGDTCEIFGIPYRTVPMTADLTVDLAALKTAAEAHDGAAMVYLTNPNNPTGDLIPAGEVAAWIRSAPDNLFFLVDEAYFELVSVPGHESAVELLKAGQDNLLVTRTFSKIFGMAGMRMGYGLAETGVARTIGRYKGSSNLNMLGLHAAAAALEDGAFTKKSLQSNARAKAILTDALDQLSLGHIPSHTNFLFHEIGADLGQYSRHMLEHGFRVGRQMGDLRRMNRLSLGTPAQMERFADTLVEFRRQGWV